MKMCCQRAFATATGALLSGAALLTTAPAAADDHLLLCEVVLSPTEGEFIEIVNPTDQEIDLDTYYLADDDDYAMLPGFFGGGPAPSFLSSDFLVQFPAGASIDPGEVVVVALTGQGFLATYGINPDFEIDGTLPGVPDMLDPIGTIGGDTLTNSGEGIVLFTWDGLADLVLDVDMVNAGTPSGANLIANKTGLSVDGPDPDTVASTYLDDAYTMPSMPATPGSGASTKRLFLEIGFEVQNGGNGVTGHDETTEDILATWESDSPFSPPDPGQCALAKPQPVQLSVIKTGPQTGTAGSQISYSIMVVNAGTEPALDVEIVDTLPPDVLFVAEISPDGVDLVDGTEPTIVWTTGSVGAGESFVIELIASIDVGVEGEIVNQVEVFTSSPSDDPDDNTSSATTMVIPASNWIINEILADPPISAAGDANGDGVVDTSEDEFVEIYNDTGLELDISGWSLSDLAQVRHVFPTGTTVRDQCVVVVFGGGQPFGEFGMAAVQTASTGSLGLNNSGDSVFLRDELNNLVAAYTFGAEGGMDQSITRDPDVTGPDPLVPHTEAQGAAGAIFSPGTLVDGSEFPGCPGDIEPPANLVINEVRINQASGGSTNPDEYVELRGDPETDLTGLSYVVIRSTQGNSGVVDVVIALDEQAVAADGLFLIVEDTFTLLPLFVADLIIPGGTDLFEDADHSTHALVVSFIGSEGLDLDDDDDGVLDFMAKGSEETPPWSAVVDAVGFVKTTDQPPTGTGYAYGAALGFEDVGPDGKFVPAHVYRCVPDDLWLIGTFDKFDPDGADTPAQENESGCPAGACCLPGGSCLDDVAKTMCEESFGGVWQGAGVLCAQVSCPVLAVCCLPDGSCVGPIAEDQCQAMGGQWIDGETDCGAVECEMTTPCPSDTNDDGVVDVQDMVTVILGWGGSDPAADVDGSGVVDVADLVQVVLDWGDCPM